VSTTFACASAIATISGRYGDTARSAVVTVMPPTNPDAVSIQRARYFAWTKTLLVEAATTGPGATLTVLDTSSGALIGELRSVGVGSYRGQFPWPVNPRNVTVRSSLCGSASRRVVPN
jgi:hypothetical protein